MTLAWESQSLLRPVLSDMDGVLVDSEEAQARAWGAWAERWKIDPGPVIATHGVTALEKILLFVPRLSADDAAAEAERMAREEEKLANDATALPGALELLTGPYRVAVVTSGTERLVFARLEAAGLPWPDSIVTAESVTDGKPHPEPYLVGAQMLRIPSEMCDVLEDAPAGVRSGRAAGARVIGVTTTFPEERLAGADVYVPDVAAYLAMRAVAGVS